jgi:hypothetical protein
MKKISTGFVLLFFLISSSGYGQNCQTVTLTKGQKFKYEIANYPLTIQILGSNQVKMKQKDKMAKVEQYKADILSGKVQPTMSTFETYISDVTQKDSMTEYEVSYSVSGQTYRSWMAVKGELCYLFRSKAGLTPAIVNGDTAGFTFLGTQIIPCNLKVGDNTPGYSDVSEGFPVSEKRKVRHNFHVTESDNFYQTSYTEYTGEVTSNETWTSTSKYHKIFQGGKVVSEDKCTISGKEYNCFVIGTETWTKFGTTFDVKVEEGKYFDDPGYLSFADIKAGRTNHTPYAPGISKKINKEIQRTYDRGGKRLKEMMNEVSGANEQGYVVGYKEDWFVPGLGITKTITYDNYGNISSIAKLVAIE